MNPPVLKFVENPRIAVVGLGYVGLPLAIEFAKQFETIGFDTNPRRIEALQTGVDTTNEVDREDLRSAQNIVFASNPEALSGCDAFIVTVPTPIDRHKNPDLTALRSASELVGSYLQPNCVVVYESTVYPGATEQVCVPLLERHSGLTMNVDFAVGYSPERINPGDPGRRISHILKLTSGSSEQAADYIDDLYASIITAGTYKVKSIQTAEAAKVIENTQRDVNIALINELALIFEKLGLDTHEVLQAAETKWNFLKFKPGLVGGHCIGVDPYYLTHKAQEIGYHPRVILAGREINDAMGKHVAHEVIKRMTKKRIPIADSRVLVMGFAFKENCPDIRNTRVIDIVDEISSYDVAVDVYDPCVDPGDAQIEYGLKVIEELAESEYDAIVVAVAHDSFRSMSVEDVLRYGKSTCVLYDVKGLYPREQVDGRL
ncbi:MAG: nucleotide sugar dehydrogenase [Pseudomonadota bacterium]